MSHRPSPVALAAVALLAGGCAGARKAAPPPAKPPPLGDVAFTPMEGDANRLRWSARASYFDVTDFLHALPRRFPEGCSTRLALRSTEEVQNGMPLLAASGAIAQRKGTGPCVDMDRLVHALDRIADALPQTAFTREMIQDGDRFELEGLTATGEAEVTAFAAALAETEHFLEARVVSLRKVEWKGRNLRDFRIELRFRGGT